MKLPKTIKILDRTWKITYHNKPSDVDHEGVESCLGQTNFWKNSIRIYKPKNYQEDEVWNTIFHEVFHVIVETLKINKIRELEEKDMEDVINLLATGINSVMRENNICFRK